MKSTIYIRVGAVVFVCVGIAVAALLAGHRGNSNAVVGPLQALNQAATPEIPAVAARLVLQAPTGSRESTAIGVVRSVNAIVQPASLPYIVGAISQSSPDMAAVVVAEAAALRPELASRLAQAAVDAAPLARPASDVVLTPVQLGSVERLTRVGVSQAEARVLVQLNQASIPVAAAANSVVAPAAAAPAVAAVAPVVAPVATVASGVQVAGVKTPVQVQARPVVGVPTTTDATATQQGPHTGPPAPPPPGTPETPVTVSGVSTNKPGPQKEYSDF